ncbi:MAG: hypothetical protein ACRC17_00865, partial [Culicoidibacterales bacterium]
EKIEFTGYDITPMGSLKFYYSINDVKYMYTILGAKSYETGKWKYATYNRSSIESDYEIVKKEQETEKEMPVEQIIFNTNKEKR